MLILCLIVVAALLTLYAVHELAPSWRPLQLRGSATPLPSFIAYTPTTRDGEATSARHEHGARYARWLAAHAGRRTLSLLLTGGLLAGLLVQLWLDRSFASLPGAFVLLLLCGALVAAILYGTGQEPLTKDITAGGERGSPHPQPLSLTAGEGSQGIRSSVAPLPFEGEGRGARVESREPPGVESVRAHALPLAGAAAGLLCAVIGALRVAADPWAAQMWWLAAMAIPIVVLLGRRLLRAWSGRAPLITIDRAEIGIVAGLFLLALAPRVPDLTSTLAFLHGDEASCGLFGRIFNSGQAPLLSISWYGLPMFSYAVSGVGLRVFGDTLTGLRLTNAVVGSVGVVLLYLLARELFTRRVALLAGVILAFTFLDLDLSRDGIHYIQGPTCITLTLYLLVRWLRHGGALTAFLTGISMIVDLQVYWSARVGPILVACLLALVFVFERRVFMRRWREAGWIVAGLIASGLPVLALFQATPGSFAGHQSEVSIFGHDPYTVGILRSSYGTTAIIPVLLQQLWRIATTFNARGDVSLQIGWPGSMLDTVSAALLPAALILALLRWRRWQYAILLIWFALVAGAGVVTIDPPWWPRLAALLPVIALLLAALLVEAARFAHAYVTRRRAIIGAALALVLLPMAIGNLRLVFVDYPAFARQASPMEGTLVGQYLERTPEASRPVVLSDGSMYLNYEAVRFLAPGPASAGCTLLPGQPLSQCPVAGQSKVFIFLPGRVQDVAWLERQRPGGKVVDVGSYGGSRILAYTLPGGKQG